MRHAADRADPGPLLPQLGRSRGRGLHSSTFHFNVSTLSGLHAYTFRLDVITLCVMSGGVIGEKRVSLN